MKYKKLMRVHGASNFIEWFGPKELDAQEIEARLPRSRSAPAPKEMRHRVSDSMENKEYKETTPVPPVDSTDSAMPESASMSSGNLVDLCLFFTFTGLVCLAVAHLDRLKVPQAQVQSNMPLSEVPTSPSNGKWRAGRRQSLVTFFLF